MTISDQYGRGKAEEVDVVKFIDNEEYNQRRYVHLGCTQWEVELLDARTGPPKAVHCPRCHRTLPTEREA